MKMTVNHFKLLADISRIRILMLLDTKELCVCQIMGVLFMSQPLVSRNVSLLHKGGFLDDRREGKMMFYSLKKRLPEPQCALMEILRRELAGNTQVKEDLRSLKDCTEYQKKSGKCDMETYLAYMRRKKEGRL
ncbi:MAG TPA: metalloregulator ArsR/SmtB family transcription factor [Dissulfurispiraceae bacterium]|nr:metalloregulator ArsR/SmtB family transcription factor [Dissulfurispiraceae bacterium]